MVAPAAVNDDLPNGTATVTTLEELLNDDSFGITSSSAANSDNDESREYNECLTTFVRGEVQECLQKMYEYGYLTQESLEHNNDLFNLFQGACDDMKSFTNLDPGIKEVIRNNFTGDIRQLNDHMSNISLAPRIFMSNKYYKCCVKVIKMDVPENETKAQYLETRVKNSINRLSYEVEGKDDDEVSELQQLVETYIFCIQISLLRKSKSPNLYKRLCESSPQLTHHFQKASGNGTVEKHILDRLEAKHPRVKKPQRRHSNSSAAIAISSPTAPTEKTLPRMVQKHALQAIPQWKLMWQRYFSKIHFTRQTLLVLLLLLLISIKNVKKINKIPRQILMASKSIIPHLTSVLKLLSSI